MDHQMPKAAAEKRAVQVPQESVGEMRGAVVGRRKAAEAITGRRRCFLEGEEGNEEWDVRRDVEREWEDEDADRFRKGGGEGGE